MKIILISLFFVAFVSTIPFKRQAVDYVETFEKVMDILKGYGIDREAMREKMIKYWEEDVHDEVVKAIVTKFLPSDLNQSDIYDLVYKLEVIDGSELPDDEKSEKMGNLIKEAGGDGAAVLKGMYVYLTDPTHTEKIIGDLKQYLPADANIKEIEEKVKAVYV